MATCDPKLLPALATCFRCVPPDAKRLLNLYLLNIATTSKSVPQLAAGAAPYRPIHNKLALAARVYLLALISGQPTSPGALEKAAVCWQCIPVSERLDIETYLYAVTAGGSTDPKKLMPSAGLYRPLIPIREQVEIYLLNAVAMISTQAIMAGAACFMCLSTTRLDEIYLYLLCQGIATNIIPPGSTYGPGATPEFDLNVASFTTYTIMWGANDLYVLICGVRYNSTGAGTSIIVFTKNCTLMQFFGTFAGTTVTARVMPNPAHPVPATPTGFTWAISGANAVAGWNAPPVGVVNTEVWTSADGVTYTLAGTVAAPGTSFSTAAPTTPNVLWAEIRFIDSQNGYSTFTTPLVVDGYEPVCGASTFDAADYMNNSLSKGCGWAGAAVVTAGAFSQFNYQNQNGIWQLGNNPSMDWRRQTNLGNNWNRLRIAILYTVDTAVGPAALNIDVGVQTALKTLVQANGNFVGQQYGGGVGWSYTVDGAGDYIQPGATDRYAITFVNTVPNSVSYGSNGVMQVRSTLHRTLLVTDIVKGSPNYTVRAYRPALIADSQRDFTFADLVTAMQAAENANMTISGKTLNVFSQAIAYSETNGNADTIEVFMGNSSVYLIAVAVKKLA